jgi:methylmalonyl-CoA/ethylmalonyl-CoA epimerase
MFKLHHVGILVRDIPQASAEYVSRYGYQIKSDIIHDPVQTAFVQFLQLAGDSSYLEFVAPDRPESKLTNALKKGGGVNHVCYATDDILLACRQLEESGMFLIQAPLPAVAFPGRRIAWLMGSDQALTELVEQSPEGRL